MEAGIRKRLADFTGISALVGARVCAVSEVRPGTPLPFITFQRVASEHVHAFDGAVGIAFATMQIDCYATTYVAAVALSEQVRLALDGYSGTPVTGGTELAGVLLNGINSVPQPPSDGSETAVHRMSLDFSVGYVESIPT